MSRALRLPIAVTAACVVGLSACGGSAKPAATGLSLHVDRDPFRLSLLDGGRLVVRESTSPARLRFQLRSGGAQYALTRVTAQHGDVYDVATTESHHMATVRVARIAHGFRISVRIAPAADVLQVYDAFDTQREEHFLGGGERGDRVDLRGQVLPVYVSDHCSYAPVPFFASSAGWGLRLEGHDVSGLAFPGSTGGAGCALASPPACSFPALGDRVDVCTDGPQLVEDLYTGTFAQVLAHYQSQTGPPLVPPPSELATIKWRGRDVFASQADVLDDVHRLRAAGIPIGWVLLDDVWQTCMGTLQFDAGKFPDPAGLVRDVHALGVRFMLWISPKSVCGTHPASELLGPPGDTVVDLAKPDAAAAFEGQLRPLVALGIDGFKADRGDEVDLTTAGEALQNDYPKLYAQIVMSMLPRGSASIFRAASAGSQRLVPGLWGGDQSGDWAGLQRAIRSGETAAMSGFPTWGSDVGGWTSQSLTADVFARWAQLGAVSPIFEVGGDGPNATPWTLGATAMAALRDAAVLHYELFPYLYGLLSAGQPVLRPLAYGYPADPRAWSHELELLVGPDLLAAPLTSEGTTASVYLPAGTWVDLYSGMTVQGGATLTRPTPLTQLPLYLRAGAVVPFNLRTARDSWWGVDELRHAGRAGYLVANLARLDLRRQPRDVQLLVPAVARPHRVTLAGRRIAWSWKGGAFPGVLIRVHGPTVRGQLALG